MTTKSPLVSMKKRREIRDKILLEPAPLGWKPQAGCLVLYPEFCKEYYIDPVTSMTAEATVTTLYHRSFFATVLSARMIDPDIILIADIDPETGEIRKSRKILAECLRPYLGNEFDKPKKVAKEKKKPAAKKSRENIQK